MKVYVAAPYPARSYVESLFPVLAAAGHECTSMWARAIRDIHAGTVGASLDTEFEKTLKHAEGDLYDVARSGALISLTASFLDKEGAIVGAEDPLWLHTGGRHVELGYALGCYPHRKVITVGEPENIFQRTLTTVVPDLAAALDALA